MKLFSLYNKSEDVFSLPEHIKTMYGPFGFPAGPPDRPYTTSNFVMSLDGLASFIELAGHTTGKEVARSDEDRWMMDFIRAHHDAQILGANTLRAESAEGWDYGIDDPDLLQYRAQTLELRKQKVMILSGSGHIQFDCKVFNSERIEPWIITSKFGLDRLESTIANHPNVRVIAIGDDQVDMKEMMKTLRHDHGISRLLCEGGPSLYGQLLQQGLIDEDFRTISAQVLGKSSIPGLERPTTYGNLSYSPGTAPWFDIVSVHMSPPHHLFLRLRHRGPRRF